MLFFGVLPNGQHFFFVENESVKNVVDFYLNNL